MIRAAFFDIDGTLLSHRTGEVPQSAKRALKLLRDKGIRIFTATGRHFLEIQELPVNDMAFDGHVTLNGQLCLDGKGRVLFDAPVEERAVKAVLPVFGRKEIPVMLVEENRIYINYVNEYVEQAQKAISTPVPRIGVYAGEKVYQINFFTDRGTAKELIGRMPDCKMTCWHETAFDIIPKGGGKTAGIRKILEYYHILPEEAMAFGDGENDLEMLRFAGIGVAMGNAAGAVREAADFVTDDIDCGGVEKALGHFGLL